MKTRFILRNASASLASAISVLLLMAAAVLAPIHGNAEEKSASDVLDGKIFIGEYGVKGNEAAMGSDEVRFENGKFQTASGFDGSFIGGAVTTTVKGDVVHFKAETLGYDNVKIPWQGTVRGDALEATYTFTKKVSSAMEQQDMWFKGSLALPSR